MATRRKLVLGPTCRHCELGIKREPALGVFVHVATGNIYCHVNLPGLTAKYASPR